MEQPQEKTPLNFLQAGRTAGPEQRRGREEWHESKRPDKRRQVQNRKILENFRFLRRLRLVAPQLELFERNQRRAVGAGRRLPLTSCAAATPSTAAFCAAPGAPRLPGQVGDRQGHNHQHDDGLMIHDDYPSCAVCAAQVNQMLTWYTASAPRYASTVM